MRRFKQLAENFSTLNFNNFRLLLNYINELNIDTVIDVGANNGQFAIDLRHSGYQKRIISYEPIPREFELLRDLCEKDGKWIARNLAVSSNMGKVLLNVSNNHGLSSSLLSMNDAHVNLFPRSNIIEQLTVDANSLSNEIEILKIDCSSSLLKIDTQGTELDVLESAINELTLFPLIYIELSHVHLYSQDKLASEVITFLHSCGFSMKEFFVASRNSKGELVQSDVLFINNKFFSGN